MTKCINVKAVGLDLDYFLSYGLCMAKKKMGRPPLAEGEAKGKLVQARLSEADHDTVQQAADAAGVKVSQWVRERLVSTARKELRQK